MALSLPDYIIERGSPDDGVPLREILTASVPALFLPLIEPFLYQGLSVPSGEEIVLVARDRVGGALTGFAVCGLVAGTLGAGRVRGVAVAPLARRRGVGRALLKGALRTLSEHQARFALVELSDEPAMRFLSALLQAEGFVEESRAAGLVREDVAMRYLRKGLPNA